SGNILADALVKIEAYNNGDGSTPPALSVADYTAAGITYVTDANLAAVNAKVLAQDIGGADTVSEVQALVNSTLLLTLTISNNKNTGEIAIAHETVTYTFNFSHAVNDFDTNDIDISNGTIKAGATLTANTEKTVYTLEITPDSNLEAGSEMVVTVAADAAENTAGNKNSVTTHTQTINTTILTFTAHTTAADVLGDSYNLVVDFDENITKGTTGNIVVWNSNTNTAVETMVITSDKITIQDDKLIINPTANLATGNYYLIVDSDAIIGSSSKYFGGIDNTTGSIWSFKTKTLSAIEKIEAYNNGYIITPLVIGDYTAADVTGVNADNLSILNAQIFAQDPAGADTKEKVQALVTLANALIKIETYNVSDSAVDASRNPMGMLTEGHGDGTPDDDSVTALSAQDYLDAGITGANTLDLDTASVNLLIQMTKNTQTANQIKLNTLNTEILMQAVDGADTQAEIQALVSQANAFLKIKAYAFDQLLNNGDANIAEVTQADYTAASGIVITDKKIGVLNDVVALQQGFAVSMQNITHLKGVIGFIDIVVAALAKIKAYIEDTTNDPDKVPTVQDYQNTFSVGITAHNLAGINAVIKLQNVADADEIAEIQPLVYLGVIEGYNLNDGAGEDSDLSTRDYENIGITTGISHSYNLAAVNAQVAAQDAGGADTKAKIEALIPLANATIAKIEAYNNSDGSNPLSIADYHNAGIFDVNEGNLLAVNVRVLSAEDKGADTIDEIKVHIFVAKQSIQLIEDYTEERTSLSVFHYTNIGIIGVSGNNTITINALVLQQADGDADTVPEIQAIVDQMIATAISKISAYADDATQTEPVLQDYYDAGITGVTNINIGAINAFINAADKDVVGTQTEIQAVVDRIVSDSTPPELTSIKVNGKIITLSFDEYLVPNDSEFANQAFSVTVGGSVNEDYYIQRNITYLNNTLTLELNNGNPPLMMHITYGVSDTIQDVVNNKALAMSIYSGINDDETIVGTDNLEEIFIGNGGDDTLTGGTGSDIFAYNAVTDGNDTITDFNTGNNGDKINIVNLLVGYNSLIMLSQFVALNDDGSNTVLTIDANGTADNAGVADINITLTGVTGVTLEDMVASHNLIPTHKTTSILSTTAGDGVTPVVTGIQVGVRIITIAYDKNLDANEVPSNNEFDLSFFGIQTASFYITDNISIADNIVTLELNKDLNSGDSHDIMHLTYEYNTIADVGGNKAAEMSIYSGKYGRTTSETITGTDNIKDIFIGNEGDDILTGGVGRDVFCYNATTDGNDTITDFATGSDGDKISLSNLLVGYDSILEVSEFVSLNDDGSNSVLTIDANGTADNAGAADINITLTGVTGVILEDLVVQNMILE
ncbi:MAG: type I secretion C-terminal target domain-containing protein, partial [Gammaproteobacteria bacterium]|nr:type I secretion C-terminal target domain-containing protein [Gammaproteobacteria bacterium]